MMDDDEIGLEQVNNRYRNLITIPLHFVITKAIRPFWMKFRKFQFMTLFQ